MKLPTKRVFYLASKMEERSITESEVEKLLETIAVIHFKASQSSNPFNSFVRRLQEHTKALGIILFSEGGCIYSRGMEPDVFDKLFPDFERKNSSGIVSKPSKGKFYVAFPFQFGQIAFVFQEGEKETRYLPLIVGVTFSLEKFIIAHRKDLVSASGIFLSTLAHDMKNPLNSIVQMTFLLKESIDRKSSEDLKKQKWIEIMIDCSNQLVGQLNNFLAYDSLQNKRLKITASPLDISKLVNEACRMFFFQAREKKITIVPRVQSGLPMFSGDHVRIMQILTNLLANSIKFTSGVEETQIKLKVHLRNLPAEKTLYFSVKDQGIGISKKVQPFIFEPFEQGDIPQTQRSKGSGLGLWICKNLCRLMGGDMEVHSKGSGRGARFRFWIHLDPQIDLERLHQNHRTLFNDAKILVVDDIEENRLYLSQLLVKWGCIPTLTSSAREALIYLEGGHPFDVAICDIFMKPGMSGVQLAEKIKTMEKYKRLPLIALSSDETQAGKELFDWYLVRPVDENSIFSPLLDCLEKSVGSKKLRTSNTSFYTKKKFRDMNALIVEDDIGSAVTLKETLIGFGVPEERIWIANNGSQAMNFFTKGNIDCVFMDYSLPDGTGDEYCRQMKRRNPNCYVIFVTGTDSEEIKTSIMKSGADTLVSKPVFKNSIRSALVRFY